MSEPMTTEERRFGTRLAAHLDALAEDDPAVVLQRVLARTDVRRSRRRSARPLLLAAALLVLVAAGLIAGGGSITRLLADTVVLPPDPTLPPRPSSVAPSGPGPSALTPAPTDPARLVNGDVLISYGGRVYLVDPSGAREPAELTGPDGDDWGAQWSPDGSRLLVLNGSVDGEADLTLYVMSQDGRSIRQITATAAVPLQNAQDPAWSPDGTRIAVRATHAGIAGIFVVSVDEPAIVAEFPGHELLAPAWAPDGGRLVVQNGPGNLAVVAPGSPDVVPIQTGATVSDPIWTLDGWIAFTKVVGGGERDFHAAVFRIRPDGTGLTQLTDPGMGRLDVNLVASQNASLLGYTRQDQYGISSPAICCGTVVRSMDTGAERLLPLGAGAVFSPDGTWMVATGPAPGDSESLKVAWIAVPVDGGASRVLLVRTMFSGPTTGDDLSWGTAP
jgi:WD40 repeat protein